MSDAIMQRWVCQADLAQRTGAVIPAYFTSRPDDALVRQLLWITLCDSHLYSAPEQVWVVVDGDARTARIAAEIGEALARAAGVAPRLLQLPENRGKLWAIREGMRRLLAEAPQVEYLAVRDCDGDHAAADLAALARAAAHIAHARGDGLVLVAGTRRSRHHPMGLLRGELETLLDAVTLDALAYALARQGRALDLARCTSQPVDLSSGYKVYGRDLARLLFGDEAPQLVTMSEPDYWRYGPETVTFVEALLAGASFAEAPRLTFDGQPTSSFGDLRAVALYGELLAWVYARLEIPVAVAARFYDNHTTRLLLRTMASGQEALAEVREYALARLTAYRGEAAPLPSPTEPLPFL